MKAPNYRVQDRLPANRRCENCIYRIRDKTGYFCSEHVETTTETVDPLGICDDWKGKAHNSCSTTSRVPESDREILSRTDRSYCIPEDGASARPS